MSKYIFTLIFYLVAFASIYLLNKASPNAHDGGLGLGSLAVLLLGLIMLILLVVNLYKGISLDKEYFILAAIHLVLLAGGLYMFFL